MTGDDFRARAAAVRGISLQAVLACWGAHSDRSDTSRWHTACGPVSVTGSKFFNWHQQTGGGGAIDLVMHLSGWDISAAVQWLEQHLGCSPAASANTGAALVTGLLPPASGREPSGQYRRQQHHRQLRLPMAHPNLQPVLRYLTDRRALDPNLLQGLIDAGKIYADQRGNVVFVMVAGRDNHPIGAELRGTGPRPWHGLAPGTQRDAGYFWTGTAASRKIILCESAIDAISCAEIHRPQQSSPHLRSPDPHWPCLCISTAGVRSNPSWLSPLLARGYEIYCGFDDDEPGNAASRQMILRHPSIKRLRPPAHDWNDALTSRR